MVVSKVLATPMVPVEILRIYSLADSTDVLFLYRNLLETILNNILNTFMYLGNKVRKTQPPKIVGKLLEHTNGASTGKSGSITNKTTLSN